MGIITFEDTMKFAILVVVVALISCEALAQSRFRNNGRRNSININKELEQKIKDLDLSIDMEDPLLKQWQSFSKRLAAKDRRFETELNSLMKKSMQRMKNLMRGFPGTKASDRQIATFWRKNYPEIQDFMDQALTMNDFSF